MASVGEFTVLISRVGYTMVRTPLGVLGDFLLRLRRLWFDLFEDCIRQAFVDATKKIVLSILFLDDSIPFAYSFVVF